MLDFVNKISLEGGNLSRKSKSYPAFATFVKFQKYSRRYFSRYLGISFLILGLASLTVLYSESLRRVINSASEKNSELLVNGLLIMLAVILFDFIFKYFKNLSIQMLNNLTVYNIQSLLISKIFKIKIKEFDNKHSSDIIYRLKESAVTAQTGINTTSFELIGSILQIIFMLTYLGFLNPILMIGSVAIGFLLPTIIKNKGANYNRKHYDQIQINDSDLQAFAQDTIQGSEIIRSYSLADRLSVRYSELLNRRLKSVRKTLLMQSLVSRMHTFSKIYGLVFIFAYGGYQVLNQNMDIGGLIAFSVSYHQAILPISNISSTWINLQQSISNAHRVLEIMDLEEDDRSQEKHKYLPGTLTDISFLNVSFSYDQKPVLHNVTFKVEKSSITAIVGPSGSGKSTLYKLLQRMYEIESGAISINGFDIQTIPLEQLRESISIVDQDPYLFSGTIYENISFGNVKASREEVIEAARAANIHEFILSTKDQYDTLIGERGITFSGGERQRISIARAFLKKSDIILLDEPTSSLDSESEALIQKSIEKLIGSKTTLIIAHRLSTIMNADKIIYFENGEVVEYGTHHELINLNGKYHRAFYSTKIS